MSLPPPASRTYETRSVVPPVHLRSPSQWLLHRSDKMSQTALHDIYLLVSPYHLVPADHGTQKTYNCGPSSSIPAINNATPNGLLITLSSPSAPSPNFSAKSHTACVQLSTPNLSLK